MMMDFKKIDRKAIHDLIYYDLTLPVYVHSATHGWVERSQLPDLILAAIEKEEQRHIEFHHISCPF